MFYFKGISQVPEKLFYIKSPTEINLNENQLEKFNYLKNKNIYKDIYCIKIGNVKNLTDLNEGIVYFNLPVSDTTYKAINTKSEFIDKENYFWKGYLIENEGYIKIICKEGEIFGSIQVENRLLEIQSFEKNKSVIFEYQNDKVENIEKDDYPKNSITNINNDIISRPFDVLNNEKIIQEKIDILIFYTNGALNEKPNISQTAELSISDLNDVFENSHIDQYVKANLAGLYYLSGYESANLTTMKSDVKRLNSDSNAKNKRIQKNADLVVLLTEEYDGGYSGYVSSIGPKRDSAYAIVEAKNATSTWRVFSHEIGHLFGGVHDNESGTYNHGYAIPSAGGGSDLTLMHHQFPRINYFSNPDVFYYLKRTGTTSYNNVARKIRETCSSVAAFSPLSPMIIYITGPSPVQQQGTYTYSANISGGIVPYYYNWEYGYDNFNFTSFNTSANANLYIDQVSTYLRLTVYSWDSQTKVAYYQVDYFGGGLDGGSGLDVVSKNSTTKNLKSSFQQKAFNIFPNPADNNISIEFTEIPREIKIYSTEGKLILNEKVESTKLELNINKYPNGLYLVKIIYKDNVINDKFIKK